MLKFWKNLVLFFLTELTSGKNQYGGCQMFALSLRNAAVALYLQTCITFLKPGGKKRKKKKKKKKRKAV